MTCSEIVFTLCLSAGSESESSFQYPVVFLQKLLIVIVSTWLPLQVCPVCFQLWGPAHYGMLLQFIGPCIYIVDFINTNSFMTGQFTCMNNAFNISYLYHTLKNVSLLAESQPWYEQGLRQIQKLPLNKERAS